MKPLTRLALLIFALTALAAFWFVHSGGRSVAEAQLQPAVTPANRDGAALNAILREIAANHWQGYRDDNVFEPLALDAIFQARKLSAHCFFAATYGEWRLTQAGFRARKIVLMNTQPETWDGRSDSHTLLEVWHPDYDQWIVVDLFFNRLYPQTAVSFLQQRVEPVMLADDPYSNPAEFDTQLPEPETWELGYDHLAQLLVIQAGYKGRWWYGDHANINTVVAYNAHLNAKYRYRSDFLDWAYGSS